MAVATILARAWARQPGFACFANVHMVMEAHDDPRLAAQIRQAFLIAPDGQPLRWALRLRGRPLPDRCYGPTTADRVCAAAAAAGLPIGLYGGRPEVIATLQQKLPARFPGLRIAYAHSPPFRCLSAEEDAQITQDIQDSGARILLVGLGCPKQERWAAAHAQALNLPILAVGAWFDFAAGTVAQAPRWMQRCGLEWLYRFSQEPRRLWRRYAVHNPRFIAGMLAKPRSQTS
ncbi:MAG: glycosyltransferase [Planctomycetota bacterium]|nr:MAG: glycosyltransferase [Planctomycetota bacterium]